MPIRRWPKRSRNPPWAWEPGSFIFKILHQDPHLLVVDKPCRLFTQPQVKQLTSESLAEALAPDFPELMKVGGSDWGACHRLDYETSGLVVFARTQVVYDRMREFFGKGLVEKEYVACVHGEIGGASRIDAPLAADPKSKKKVKAYANRKEAIRQNAVYALTLVEPLTTKLWPHTTLLKVKIVTGFRHQIRVHLKHIGHPIVGDPLYGDKPKDFLLNPGRLFLHAARLGFEHPVTGKNLEVKSEASFQA